MSAQITQLDAAVQAHASYIYVVPWLCTTTICPAVIGKYEVYEDPYHITTTYGDYLAPVLQNALKDSGDLMAEPTAG